MIVMALDHVRDFFHSAGASGSPTDLNTTTPALFLTRWITHFCLPVFMFLAGTGAFLWGQGRSRSQLSHFLWTRGLWFVVLELIVMRLAYNFNFSLRLTIFLLVLWIFGICMIAMAALVYLPFRWLAAFSLAIIALHNSLDGVAASRFGSGAWIWNLLHQPGVFMMKGIPVVVSYPLLPWIGVMAAGFCFGRVFLLDSSARRNVLLKTGLALTIAFVAIRDVNIYGDPVKWSPQKSGLFTVLSFINCTKYPGSLDFLLMTLGPALLVLAFLDRFTFKPANPLIVFGRVPLFYFVLHFYAIHALAVFMAWLRYGPPALTFMFNPVPAMGGPQKLFPADFGYSLWGVYGAWILIVFCLYPLCRWYGKLKASRRDWWFSYL
jgi:uncharacterized membrane protein